MARARDGHIAGLTGDRAAPRFRGDDRPQVANSVQSPNYKAPASAENSRATKDLHILRKLFATLTAGAVLGSVASARADGEERWSAPFGGYFSANFTLASEYSQSGISQTQLQPAVQAGLDYRTSSLIEKMPVWLYASIWGSNIDFPVIGSGAEIQFAGGMKARLFDRRMSLDIGYIEHAYPGIPSDYSLDYGEINFNLGYDFGIATLGARVRYSANGLGNSGINWNKRALLSVPLPFLFVNESISFKAYGSVGNVWFEKPLGAGIPSPDYWYWQVGIITSLYGLDINLAYTDTSIDPSGCQSTRYCAGRVLVAISKVF